MAENASVRYEYEHVEILPYQDIHFEHYFDSGSLVSNHWHNEIELIYLLEGELDVSIGKKTWHYKKDDLILINSKVVHSTLCAAPNESILVQMPYGFLKRYMPDLDDYVFYLDSFSKDPVKQTKILQTKEILQKMLVVTSYHPDGEHLRFNSLLFDLLYMLYHDFRTNDLQAGYQRQAKDLNKLEGVLEYTQEHYAEPVSLHEIAAVAGFQPEYFCRLFKRNMGVTYLEYLSEIRLSHIYEDLLTTDESIQRLLELHGFTNYKLFRKMFAEKFHMTPMKVRKGQV